MKVGGRGAKKVTEGVMMAIGAMSFPFFDLIVFSMKKTKSGISACIS